MIRTLAIALLLAFAACLAAFSPAFAEDPVILDLQIDSPEAITVGDHVTYVITIEAGEGVEFTLVQASLPPVVEVVGTPRTTSRSAGDGRVEITMTVELAVFYVGDVPIPPIALRYVGDDGTGTIEMPASRLIVASILPSGGEVSPLDLKPQADIGLGSPAWVVPAISATTLALVVVATLLFWRIRRIQERAAAVVPEPMVAAASPEDRARLVLDKTGVDFGADGDYATYYRAIGVTVRTYLSDRYGFPAFALTTRELEAEMLHRGLDRWQVRVAGGLLTQCDSVVYAQYRPAAERADADLTAAYEIVEMSRPQTPEPVLTGASS